MILDGKTLAQTIKQQLKKELKQLSKTLLFTPKIATILVGEDEASKVYVTMKRNAAHKIGLQSVLMKLDEQTTTEELLKHIQTLNDDPEVCGILLQHPVPKHIDEAKCFNAIAPNKDIDGVNTQNFGKMAMGQPAYYSATPLGIMLLLKHYQINLEGLHAVVVGRSQILGKPLASMLLNENATVTIAHSKTKNLPQLLKQADLVIACVGKPHFVKVSQLKQGVVVIDAGYNKGNLGDVDPTNLSEVASAYTPVPGGVGPMTIAALLSQAVKSIKNSKEYKK
jgi:methylenetetrahydrofolate dehydrogenase (NADP+)/methenyltetrahydrofolate cyclohydrolase